MFRFRASAAWPGTIAFQIFCSATLGEEVMTACSARISLPCRLTIRARGASVHHGPISSATQQARSSKWAIPGGSIARKIFCTWLFPPCRLVLLFSGRPTRKTAHSVASARSTKSDIHHRSLKLAVRNADGADAPAESDVLRSRVCHHDQRWLSYFPHVAVVSPQSTEPGEQAYGCPAPDREAKAWKYGSARLGAWTKGVCNLQRTHTA